MYHNKRKRVVSSGKNEFDEWIKTLTEEEYGKQDELNSKQHVIQYSNICFGRQRYYWKSKINEVFFEEQIKYKSKYLNALYWKCRRLYWKIYWGVYFKVKLWNR